jgi:hypothetical protein
MKHVSGFIGGKGAAEHGLQPPGQGGKIMLARTHQ